MPELVHQDIFETVQMSIHACSSLATFYMQSQTPVVVIYNLTLIG